jgi:hypothetical protein
LQIAIKAESDGAIVPIHFPTMDFKRTPFILSIMSAYDPSDPSPSRATVRTGPDYLDENVNLELVEEGLEVAEDEIHEAALERSADPDPEISADEPGANDPLVRDDPSPETSAINIRRAP